LFYGETCSPELRDDAVIADEVTGADDDQVITASVSKMFDFRQPF
jgi:hypothetical protein